MDYTKFTYSINCDNLLVGGYNITFRDPEGKEIAYSQQIAHNEDEVVAKIEANRAVLAERFKAKYHQPVKPSKKVNRNAG